MVEIASQLNIPPGTIRRWKSTYKWDSESSESKPSKSEHSENISWIEREKEYVTDIRKKSLEDLAEKYNIAIGTIQKYSMDHIWSLLRKEYKENIKQKVIEKASEKDANRIDKLVRITETAVKKQFNCI